MDYMSNISLKQKQGHDFAPDKIIALSLLCLSIAFIVWAVLLKHYALELPSVIAAASLFYLAFRGRLSKDESLPKLRNVNRIRSVVRIIFIASISLSILLLWSNMYYRPPLYFALLLVATACIILEILCLSEEKTSQTTIVLFEIIVLSLSIYAGIYYQFSGIYGTDPWWHNEWIQETVNLGHITRGEFLNNGYYLFPVFHLLAAMVQTTTSLASYSAVFISTGVFMAMSCVFIFLIGRKLINTKVGLLAALIVPLTTNSIQRATAIIPMSLGFCFVLVILYLVFCQERKTAVNSFLIILLSISLILTHTIAALVMLVSLVAIHIGIKLCKQISRPITPYETVSLTLILFFGVAMLTRWMQSPTGTPAFFDLSLAQFLSSLQMDAQFALATPVPPASIPYGIKLLNSGGYLLLLGFAAIGALINLHPKNRTEGRVALVFMAGMLFFLPYSFILFQLENILPSRWIIFLYVPLAILALQGLRSISNLLKYNLVKLGVMILVLLTVIFIMTTNCVANNDSPWVYNGAIRSGYTQSELTAIETLSDMRCGCPRTDLYYGLIFPYVIGYDKYMEMTQGSNEIFVERNYYLRHPEWNEKYRERIIHSKDESAYVLILDYMKEQGLDEWPLIYSNGNTKTYAIPKAE